MRKWLNFGVESARSNGIGITVSYWETEESIRNWKNHEKHLVAQHKGRSGWYSDYHVRITQVEREYEFDSRKKWNKKNFTFNIKPILKNIDRCL